MSRVTTGIVQRIYEQLNSTGELPRGMFMADCVVDLTHVGVGAGELRGIAVSQRALAEYFKTFDDFHVTAEVLHADDRRVVTAIRDGGRMKGSTAEVWNHYFHAWTLRDGQVARLSSHTERDEAFKAVGLDD